jgi:hypothetical protein
MRSLTNVPHIALQYFLIASHCISICDGTAVPNHINSDLGEDVCSLMQVSLKPAQLNARRSAASTEHRTSALEGSIVPPYEAFTARRQDISDLPEGHSLGELMAYEPTTARNSDVLVFLPGSWAPCSNYTYLLETIGSSMMTLCLPYDNIKSMGELCDMDEDCWYKKRLEAYNGSFEGIERNNVIARLRSALAYLARVHATGWATFLTPSGLRLEAMRFAGHSMGAGLAAMVGYQTKVARVFQLSGPCDPAAWMHKSISATPSNRFFSLTSSNDRFCDWEWRQVPALYSEGIQTERFVMVSAQNLSSFDPDADQAVISTIPSPSCVYEGCWRDNHEAVAMNYWGSKEKVPYAKGLWQKLAGI